MREKIISEIKRLERELGRPPGKEIFRKSTGVRHHEWMGKFWANWGDALSEAGFSPNALAQKIDSNFLLEQLAQACLELEKLPSAAELELHCRQRETSFSPKALERHYPRRALLIEALRDWVSRNPTYQAVADMLPATSQPQKLTAATPDGYVYLIRAGEFYKIGRSDQLERRVKEIRIALPQAATLEHTITTDDPSGIEAYWHRRFADRRQMANGFSSQEQTF